ncbi:hypothetical protein D2E26_0814 [Bifidobacterium dolichotidis]|uniref:Secreted protein n=1 Tax=Bifidobacterium dolichotidis TaxID=2306976 RepID=A0A430FPJ3_9BIFI|nr:hypothetical protein [Bifidobacterium dolichotidis]RSX54760.1 hypothetical protein D2E26_0814 [Bifidobacterium dolichotidis]
MTTKRHTIGATFVTSLLVLCCGITAPAQASPLHRQDQEASNAVYFRKDKYGCGKKVLYTSAKRRIIEVPVAGGTVSLCAATEHPMKTTGPTIGQATWHYDAGVVYKNIDGLQHSKIRIYLQVPIYSITTSTSIGCWYLQNSTSEKPSSYTKGEEFRVIKGHTWYESLRLTKYGTYTTRELGLGKNESYWRAWVGGASNETFRIDAERGRLCIDSTITVKAADGTMHTYTHTTYAEPYM